jgi:hypothetical protein
MANRSVTYALLSKNDKEDILAKFDTYFMPNAVGSLFSDPKHVSALVAGDVFGYHGDRKHSKQEANNWAATLATLVLAGKLKLVVA